MSDATRTELRIIEEVTFGATPSSPALKALRFTTQSLASVPQTVESQETTPSAQIADAIIVGSEHGGEFGQELAYGVMDDYLPGAMRSAWAVKNEATCSGVVASTDTYTTPAQAVAWAEGMLVRATGFTNAGNNGLFRLVSGTSTTAVTDDGRVDETPPATAKLKLVGFECATGDAAYNSGTKTLTVSSASGDLTDLGLVAGEWVNMSGWDTAGNNGPHRVASVTSTTLVFDEVPDGATTENAGTQTVRIWLGDYIRNGTTPRSYTIEKKLADLTTPEYHMLRGYRIGTVRWEAEPKAIINVAVNGIAAGFDLLTTRVSGASDAAGSGGTHKAMNTSNHVGKLSEAGVGFTAGNKVLGFTIELDNGLRAQDQIGSPDLAGIALSRFRARGTLRTYYGSLATYQKLINGTPTSFSTMVVDPDGTRAILYDLPRIKLTGGQPEDGGVDTDRILNAEYTAIAHETLGYTMHIQRFPEIA